MKCPYCASKDTKVLDTRESEDFEVTRRRRQCLKCDKRFTTYERIETIPLIVVKRNDDREQFNRRKLLSGILRACEKRPISNDKIENLVNSIESELRKMDDIEVPSSLVGSLVMDKLIQLDDVAYIRFASVYRQFKTANQFMKEIQEKLLNKK